MIGPEHKPGARVVQRHGGFQEASSAHAQTQNRIRGGTTRQRGSVRVRRGDGSDNMATKYYVRRRGGWRCDNMATKYYVRRREGEGGWQQQQGIQLVRAPGGDSNNTATQYNVHRRWGEVAATTRRTIIMCAGRGGTVVTVGEANKFIRVGGCSGMAAGEPNKVPRGFGCNGAAIREDMRRGGWTGWFDGDTTM